MKSYEQVTTGDINDRLLDHFYDGDDNPFAILAIHVQCGQLEKDLDVFNE